MLANSLTASINVSKNPRNISTGSRGHDAWTIHDDEDATERGTKLLPRRQSNPHGMFVPLANMDS